LRAVFKPLDHYGLLVGINVIDDLKQIWHGRTFLADIPPVANVESASFKVAE